MTGFNALYTWTAEQCGGDHGFLEPRAAAAKATPKTREPGWRWLVVGNSLKFEVHTSGRKHRECANVYQTRSTASNSRGSRIVTTCCRKDETVGNEWNLRSVRARVLKSVAKCKPNKPCKAGGGCKLHKDMTYAEAEASCAASGMALCPATFLEAGEAAGKKGGYSVTKDGVKKAGRHTKYFQKYPYFKKKEHGTCTKPKKIVNPRKKCAFKGCGGNAHMPVAVPRNT